MKVLVKDKSYKNFGVLEFKSNANEFLFTYDEKQTGVNFSDINVANGRQFKQNSMFNLFSFDDSYNKNELIKKYSLEEKTENEIQWFLINLWAFKSEQTAKGFWFTKFKKIKFVKFCCIKCKNEITMKNDTVFLTCSDCFIDLYKLYTLLKSPD